MNMQILARIYSITATILLTTVILSLVAGGLFLALSDSDYARLRDINPEVYKSAVARDPEALLKVYPGRDLETIYNLLAETWIRPYLYEPFSQFRERPFTGRFVNVDSAGFRRSAEQADWPPDKDHFNIFVFGGSTTFGYGVADDETIPSGLYYALKDHVGNRSLAVYNFGRGHYYSTQERTLYEQLLTRGRVPDLAIFIDGLNDCAHYDNRPLLTVPIETYVNKPVTRASVGHILSDLKREGKALAWHFMDRVKVAGTNRSRLRPKEKVVRTYYENVKMISLVSDGYGVKTAFIWHPAPLYKYDLRYHLFPKAARNPLQKKGYAAMRRAIRDGSPSPNFLWLADIQKGINKPLYVDGVHFTVDFSREIANRIADFLRLKQLLS